MVKACSLLIDNELWGFYQSYGQPLDEDALVQHMSNALSYYAVPSFWVSLDTMPLTANGKIDKKALRELATRRRLPPTPATTSSSEATFVTQSTDSGVFTGRRNMSGTLTASQDKVKVEIFITERKSVGDTIPELPLVNGSQSESWLRHRIFILYRRFFSAIFIGNLTAFIIMLVRTVRSGVVPIQELANAVAVNLMVSVLIRQDHVVNILFRTASSVPLWVPFVVRCQLARIYHLGGIHSGCAVSATGWWLALAAGASFNFVTKRAPFIDAGTLLLTWVVLGFLVMLLTLAYPSLRDKYHNTFEWTHRYGGWTVLVLVWVHLLVVANSIRSRETPLGIVFITQPATIMVAIITGSIILPWLSLKKVAVVPVRLSPHAVRIYFDYRSVRVGTGLRIARHPLADWHAFATITDPAQPRSFSLIISNAGDFTRSMIDSSPQHVWVKGVPVHGVLTIAPLFRRIVLVCTGSGIGPGLPVILAQRVPLRVLWSTRDPVATYGQGICDDVRRADPAAVIWNTSQLGRPDLLRLAWRLFVESGAEAVCVISNKKVSDSLIYELESRGVPAFGPIFDS